MPLNVIGLRFLTSATAAGATSAIIPGVRSALSVKYRLPRGWLRRLSTYASVSAGNLSRPRICETRAVDNPWRRAVKGMVIAPSTKRAVLRSRGAKKSSAHRETGIFSDEEPRDDSART